MTDDARKGKEKQLGKNDSGGGGGEAKIKPEIVFFDIFSSLHH